MTLDDGAELRCRKLLLATGVRDHLPEIEGTRRFYGAGVFHCPYCDGWEVRDRPLAALGPKCAGLAVSLKTWSEDVILCTGGPAASRPTDAARLDRLGIRVYRQPLAPSRRRRRARADRLRRRLDHARAAAFSSIPAKASAATWRRTSGCAFNNKGTVRTGKLEGTNVPGLFVAGDASKDVQLAIVAAAEGAKAAIAINTALQLENAR